ncbi:insulinase family protein [Maribacter sp. 2307ULW6-5]
MVNPGLQLEHYTLANGLKVYLNPDAGASTIYGSVWVNAGGKDDPADATGIAHYLEHMLFKGTTTLGTLDYAAEKVHLDNIKDLYTALAQETDADRKRTIQLQINEEELKAAAYAIPNEFDRLLKSIGGTKINASTGHDYTNYYNQFPPNQLPKWLALYAHRFKDPVFRLFQSELEAVYEEKNRANDDLQRRIVQAFDQRLYGAHPYGSQTVLGSVEHLKNPSLEKMYQFFKTYYVPNNMALVLSGNFDVATAKTYIEESFGQLPKGPEPRFKNNAPHTFKGREVEKVRITPIKVGFLGYKLVPFGHPDRAALSVLGEMMYNDNETGFLDQLNLENKVLYATGYQEFLEEDGASTLIYVPKIFGRSLKHFEEKLRASFDGIAQGHFSDSYFQSIKNGMYRQFSRSLEDLETRSRYLGLSFIYDLPPAQLLSYTEALKKVDKADVQRVAQTYYGEDYLTMQSRTGFPKKEKLKKPAYKPIEARTTAKSAFAKTFETLPEEEPAPSFITMGEDVKVYQDYLYHTKNPMNNVFTLTANIAKGTWDDALLPILANALNNAGTNTHTVQALKSEFAQLGATYFFSAQTNKFQVTLTGIDDNFEASVGLLEHLMRDFKPTRATLMNLYNQRKTQNKIDGNDPATAGNILYGYGLYGNQSDYKKRTPLKELKKMEPALLKEEVAVLFAHGFNSLHYVGQKSAEESLLKMAKNPFFGKNTTNAYTFKEAKVPNETTIYVVHDKKAIQSHVYYVVQGEMVKQEDHFKKKAFENYYTDGLSGLLFQEVREFRSLAYATGGAYIGPDHEPHKKGRLVLFTGSQADKTVDAVTVVMDLLKTMPEYPDRLPSLKKGLTLAAGTGAPDFREWSAKAETFLGSGHEKDPNEQLFKDMDGLMFTDIKTFYEANIKDKPLTITIYGNTKAMDMEALGKLGKVVPLKMKTIHQK